MTETRKPALSKCGITRVSRVVLPAPLHPARPITFILLRSPHTHARPRSRALSTSLRGALATKQSRLFQRRDGLLRRSLSSGGHSPDPVARNDGMAYFAHSLTCLYRLERNVMLPCIPMMKIDKAPV